MHIGRLPCVFTDVPDELLKELDPKSGVELIESIVHADARASKIPHTSISFPHDVDTPDGGVDGRVEGAKRNSVQGAIKEGLTCFQIKNRKLPPDTNQHGPHTVK